MKRRVRDNLNDFKYFGEVFTSEKFKSEVYDKAGKFVGSIASLKDINDAFTKNDDIKELISDWFEITFDNYHIAYRSEEKFWKVFKTTWTETYIDILFGFTGLFQMKPEELIEELGLPVQISKRIGRQNEGFDQYINETPEDFNLESQTSSDFGFNKLVQGNRLNLIKSLLLRGLPIALDAKVNRFMTKLCAVNVSVGLDDEVVYSCFKYND